MQPDIPLGGFKSCYHIPLSNPKYGGIYTHGAPFLTPNIHSIWREYKISMVVSLLEAQEHGDSVYTVRHINYPVKENSIPRDMESFTRLVLSLLNVITSGQNVAIHCYSGIGRTGILATILAGILERLSGEMAVIYSKMHNAMYIQNDDQYRFTCWFIDECMKKPKKRDKKEEKTSKTRKNQKK